MVRPVRSNRVVLTGMVRSSRRRGSVRAWVAEQPSSRPATLNLPPCAAARSEEHTSELQSLMRISYAVFCLKNNTKQSYRGPHDLHVVFVGNTAYARCRS